MPEGVVHAATVWRPSVPLDLLRTLGPLRRGAGDPTHRVEGGVVWRTALTPDGPGTLRLAPVDGAVHAEAWGPGATWLVDGVPELLGEGDPVEGFAPGDGVVGALWRRHQGMRMPRTRLVVEMLVPAVLEQKVTGMEARRAWRWLVRRHGTPAPGPVPAGLMVAPPAEVWARVPSWDWHRAGVDPRRSRTVLAAVARAAALERTLALGRGGPEVVALLCTIPGIGPWTAAEVVQRAHGDADTVSVGDYHLSKTVGWALCGRPLDDAGMLEALGPWAGHRHRVVRLIEAGAPRKPGFGPRLTPEDHRRR